MKKILIFFYLLVEVVSLCGCHVYYSGSVINDTKDTLLITTKPSLLTFEKDKHWTKLSAANLSNDDSIFFCKILPFDTLAFSSGPSYSSSIGLIDYLKIERKDRDSIIMASNKDIRKRTEVFNGRFNDQIKIGMKVTDSFFTSKSKK